MGHNCPGRDCMPYPGKLLYCSTSNRPRGGFTGIPSKGRPTLAFCFRSRRRYQTDPGKVQIPCSMPTRFTIRGAHHSAPRMPS